MVTKETTSRALTHKINTIKLIKDIEDKAPQVKKKIALQWFLGHKGIEGNEKVDRLANNAAKIDLPSGHTDQPTFASFRAQ